MNTPQPLTPKENLDLQMLNSFFFKNESFIVITPEMEATSEYKKLQKLVKKKQKFLFFQRQVALN